MNRKIRQILTLILLTFSLLANAQLYPVQVNTNFIPPHNVTLSSYTTTTTNKINLRLNLTDINENNLQVRLKMIITGRGLNIQSRDFVIGALPLFLNGGQSVELTSFDLRPYFELQNLVGISPQQYNRPLPDGFYKICFQVYTAATPIPQLISNPNMGCTFVNLIINDPPILNLPQRGEQVVLKDPVNIIFQWTPRHLNATNVSYEFDIREIWDNNIDPQAAFLASPPLHQETVFSTTFLYNNFKPALLPDKTYAWRVRAISTTGISENSVFRNNGYSEIFYIKLTQDCDAPIYALSEALSTGRVKITWQGNPEHNKYHVQYKKANVSDAEWFEVFTYNEQAQISNLEAGVTYDFRVGGTCNSLTQFEQSYTYTNVNQFTMPTADETVSYNCGVVPDIQITNQDPLQNLGVNETFTAGDFPVTVKEVEGGNGRFSGVGFIVVPYLADTKIAVEFEGITINTEYQLIDGVVKTTYDPTWSSVEDVDDLFGGGAGGSTEVSVDFPIDYPDGIQIDPNGDILIISPDGGVIEVAGGKDVIITDGSSPPKQYAVDEDGNVKPLGEVAEGGKPTPENTDGVNSDGEVTDITAEGVTVTFAKSENGINKTKYGFDAYYSSHSKTKELYTKLGSNYYIPYKAVKNGDSDYLIANIDITDNTIVADSLVFKTQDGTAIEVIEKNNDLWTLKVEGFLTDADKEVLATIKQGDKYNVAGAFKLYHLEEKTIDVIAVDATTTDISNLETYLNIVYKQSVVKVNLIKTVDFTNDLNNIPLEETGKIQSGESGFLANYTNDQQLINKELKNRSDYNASAYYLIFTDKQPSTSGEKGLMPVGRQFGYIYTGGVITASHELGHGAFKLRHPFSNKSYGWNAGATNWLMDYSSGEHLPYVHWQEIHNPKIKLGIFDSDEEGEYKGKWLVSKIIQKIRCAYLSGINEVSITDDLNYFDDLFANDLFQSRVYQISLGRDTEYDFSLKFVVNRNEPIVLPQNLEAQSSTYPGLQAFVRYDFGGLDIYTTHNSNTAGYSFEDYLQGVDNVLLDSNTSNPNINEDTESIVLAEVIVTGDGILSDGIINDSEFESLKNRAICELTYLNHNTRISLIKALLKRGWRTDENEEDLILDLIHNIPTGDENAFLEEIYEQPDLLDNLWTSLDNSHFLGAENNASRFLQELLIIWKKSNYYTPSKYTYNSNSPAILRINEAQRVNDALGFKYSINLDGTDINLGIKRATRFVNFEGTRTLSYDIFQPLIVEFKSDTQWQIPQEPIPAFLLYAAKDIEDVKQMIKTLNFTFDVALTFTGVGNISKLRLLPRSLRYVRATINGVEISASLADLVLDYSSVCQGNEAVCQKLKLVTFALQIASLSADIATTNKVKRYAKEYIEEVNTSGVGISETVADELEALGGVPINNIIESTGLLNLLNKLDNFPHIRLWVSNLDEVSDVNLINKIDDLGESYWNKLNTDLASVSNGNELKTLIATGDDVDAWKLLKDDAGYAFELGEDGLGVWEKWGKANFFKVVTKKGKDFETLVCLEKFKDRLSDKYLELKQKLNIDFGKNLDEYDMYSQVQLKYNDTGDYFVADQVFVKYKTLGGQKIIDDVIIIENKLSANTRLTPNQTIAKTKNSYTVRNTRNRESEFGSDNFLKQSDELNFGESIQWYKVHDGVNGDIIKGINKL